MCNLIPMLSMTRLNTVTNFHSWCCMLCGSTLQHVRDTLIRQCSDPDTLTKFDKRVSQWMVHSLRQWSEYTPRV